MPDERSVTRSGAPARANWRHRLVRSLLGDARIPLWGALSFPFLLVGLLTFGILISAWHNTVTPLLASQSASVLETSGKQVEEQLSHYLEVPFELQRTVAGAIGRQALYVPGDLSGIERYLGSVFRDIVHPGFKQVGILQFGSVDGDAIGFYRIAQASDRTSMFLKDQRTQGQLVNYKPGGLEVQSRTDGYDPRARPWYLAGAAAAQACWHGLHPTQLDKSLLVLGAATPVRSPSGEMQGVLSTDISIRVLSSFLKSTLLMTRYKNAMLYIVDEQGQLVAQGDSEPELPVRPGAASTGGMPRAEASANALIRASFTQVQTLGSQASATFGLPTAGGDYVVRMSRFSASCGLDWRIVAVVSETELTGGAERAGLTAVWLALVAVTGGLLVGLMIIRLVVRPIRETADAAVLLASSKLGGGLPSIHGSRIKETSTLTWAFNAMARRILSQLGQLHEIATVDGATGLMNQRGLLEMAVWEGQQDVLVLLFGADNFGTINTSLGRKTGDELLRAMGTRLHQQCPPGSWMARIDGGKFLVVVPGVGPSQRGEDTIAGLAATFTPPFLTATDEVVVHASMGVVYARGESALLGSEWLWHAALALRAAKARGRSQRVDFTQKLLQQTLVSTQIASELKLALAAGELEVHFQPIVRLRDGVVSGLEALVRWTSKTRGAVGPAQFIPVAEESGLIVELGNWIMVQATTEVAQMMREHAVLEGFSLHVNVSVRQLVQSDFVQTVAHALAVSGLPAAALMVEITESLVMESDSPTQKTIEDLRQLGVGLALDDFGTGYSSLSYLNRFPFHALKIDRSFVVAAQGDPRSEAILKAVVDITRSLAVDAVAEGLETPEQVRMLTELGCSYGQGYYFGKPAPLPQILPHILQLPGQATIA